MHRQAGANCTDAKLYFWPIFQFFFYPNGTTSKLFWDFLNFFNFAKPLSLYLTQILYWKNDLIVDGDTAGIPDHVAFVSTTSL